MKLFNIVLGLLFTVTSAYANSDLEDSMISNQKFALSDRQWEPSSREYTISGNVSFDVKTIPARHVSCPFEGLKISFDKVYTCAGKEYQVGFTIVPESAGIKGSRLWINIYPNHLISFPIKNALFDAHFDETYHPQPGASGRGSHGHRSK